MILLIDNYDSFTYNVKQCIETLGSHCLVIRNDAISVQEIEKLRDLKAIVLSPGPGRPADAGITIATIKALAGKFPILGICLGHQAIGEAMGGNVIRAPRPKHGKLSRIRHQKNGLFLGLNEPLEVARYHSLIIERETLPSCLEVTAETEEGLIMAISHRKLPKPLVGVQFHPESIATEQGPQIIKNFLEEAHA